MLSIACHGQCSSPTLWLCTKRFKTWGSDVKLSKLGFRVSGLGFRMKYEGADSAGPKPLVSQP